MFSLSIPTPTQPLPGTGGATSLASGRNEAELQAAFRDKSVISDMDSRYNNVESPCREMERGAGDLDEEDDEYVEFSKASTEEAAAHLRDAQSLFPAHILQVQRSITETLWAFPPPHYTTGVSGVPPRPKSACPALAAAEAASEASIKSVLCGIPSCLHAVVSREGEQTPEGGAVTRPIASDLSSSQPIPHMSPMLQCQPQPTPRRRGGLPRASAARPAEEWERCADVFLTVFLRDVTPYEYDWPHSNVVGAGSGGRTPNNSLGLQQEQQRLGFAVQWCGCAAPQQPPFRPLVPAPTPVNAARSSSVRYGTVVALVSFNYACGFSLLVERVYCSTCGLPLRPERAGGWRDGEARLLELAEDTDRNFLTTAVTFESLSALLMYYYSFSNNMEES